ncbi:MAG: hypothetical protein HQP61_08175 [Peptococcaceae bacterium]|nr:hypothetical protein [Candidatus Syntrophopropionicum ammoniitolerans]
MAILLTGSSLPNCCNGQNPPVPTIGSALELQGDQDRRGQEIFQPGISISSAHARGTAPSLS